MPDLFTPYTLKGRTLRNRIAVSPMCQYLAVDGVAGDWHNVHYASLARGGSALVVVEATAVSPEGRITPGCLGLWNDAQADALRPIARAIRDAGAMPGIQIAHAGRKASANRPWEGDDHIAPDDPRGWETIAPSAIAFGANLPKVPRAMTPEDITRVRQDFVASAIRARDAGFEWLMLHFAHGYLGQSFLSPYSNQRTDLYGGSLENRARFLLETLSDVRAVWPEDRPLSARLGMIEFDGRDTETLEDAITLARHFRTLGLDFLDVSIGFSTPTAKIPWGPAFMAPIAARVRHESGLPVATSWYISKPDQANGLIHDESLDLVMMGRPFLENLHWPYAAARALGRPDAAHVLPEPYAHWLGRYRSE
ncbi:NADH:flavin oxidoreductase/NADH oxidase [Novacetimonas hansenii]|uniref:NADH:flavin oxidoreductase/NADH oxidase n=1 Tax=Novacetimonas hansenii TaxID=436 RepID=A0AAW5EU78_NOVHA|nr:NADH:flavin oxidoreductase/NADH oxidase [Novacetimonas hansenii]MBL7236374.1 NADH:flavin oxidoreductase/NADH oxidase [Novacetimonas hansenii]MCJ8353875.1 NADH:flavin oxidoreductase/NADH oxidase [Novacetimonas hansenii]